MSEPTLKLPRNADELLRDFPLSEPDFEAQAHAIAARLNGSAFGVSDRLLDAPALEAEAGEPALPSAVHAAPMPKSNFTEMARRSLPKKVESGDDAAALVKELLAATSHSRRPDAEMVERVRAAGKAAPIITPLPTGERASGVVVRVEAPALPLSVTPATRPPTRNSARRSIIIGGLSGALAFAACLALFIKASPSRPGARASVVATQSGAQAPSVAAPGAGRAEPLSPDEPSDGSVNPEALTAAPPVEVADAKAASAKAPAGGLARPASKPVATPGNTGKPEAVVLADEPEPGAKTRAAEPTPEPQMKPAEGSTESVPLSPSSGALSTALGLVRSDAQACLGGQNDAVTAVITFASDGRVVSVKAGGPSGACIQAALSKAHIAPFAKDRFSATTTIRPP